MKKSILALISFLITFSIYSLFKADYSTDIISMLPLEDKVIAKQYTILSAFNSMEKVVFEVSLKDSLGSWENLSADAVNIIDELKKDSVFLFNSNISPAAFFEIRNSLITKWPLLINGDEFRFIKNRLSHDSLEVSLDRAISSLYTFSSSTADPFLLKNDPFNFHPTVLKRLAAFSPSSEIRIRDGLLTNVKNDKVLIVAEFNKVKDEASALDIIDKAEKKLSDKCDFIWMGAVRASLDNSNSIKRDINVTLPITIIMILLICLLIYRNWIFGFLTFVPTLIGILITFGLFAYFSNFSLIIVGFAAALMGITVDFAIHYLYHVDSVDHDSHPLKTVRAPILASAFTTAGAFLVLCVSGIPALNQLGLITAFGIVSAALLSLFLLPLISTKKDIKRLAVFRPSSFFIRFYKSTTYKYLTIIIIIISLFLWSAVYKMQFDGDPDNMNGMSSETIRVERMLNNNWSGIGEGAYLAAISGDLDSLLVKFEESINPFVKGLDEKSLARSGGSFTELLPSNKKQEASNKLWDSLFTENVKNDMREVVFKISKKYGLSPDIFVNYIDNLNRKNREPLSIDNYPSIVKDGLLKNSLIKKDSLWIGNISIFSESDTLWEHIDEEAAKKEIIAVNDNVLGFRIVSLIKSAFLRSAVLIPIIIVIIIALILKDVRAVVQVFIPTALAAGITLGLMAVLGIKVNIVTMMVFAFIFGLGIDYSLLMYYMSKKELEKGESFQAHGAASVTVAAATTLSGLGVLVLAKHPVIVTLGITGLIGILSSYVCAVVLVPIFVEKLK